MGANFYSQFRSKRLEDLFKKLCKQNQRCKFDELWALLDKLTTSHMEDVRKKPVVAREEEPRGLEPLEGEPARITRGRKGERSVKCFSEWIKNEPLEKWALIADTDGSRHGMMTTNLAEVYNWVVKACRSLPLVAIVECILRGTMAYLRECFQEASITCVKSSNGVLQQNDRDITKNKCQGDYVFRAPTCITLKTMCFTFASDM